MSFFTEPLENCSGVGPATAERLARLNLFTAFDALLHIPLRFEDRTRLTPVHELQVDSTALVEGRILEDATQAGISRKQSTRIEILLNTRIGQSPDDELTDSRNQSILGIRFFNLHRSQRTKMQAGTTIRCFGTLKWIGTRLEMSHPEFELNPDPELERNLRPVYPTTAGLTQVRLRKIIDQLLTQLAQTEQGYTDQLLQTHFQLPTLYNTLEALHHPLPSVQYEELNEPLPEQSPPDSTRLAVEELLLHLSLKRQQARRRQTRAAPVCINAASASEAFTTTLPFQLTGAQQRVMAEVFTDLGREQPMRRLLQGDVGSGKTVIAGAALWAAAMAGHQGALMVPTELLAVQQYQTLKQLFAPHDFTVILLTGSLTSSKRRKALQAIADGTADIVVGTHALFQQSVTFQNLAITVIDEQHRFGVQQRLDLQRKAGSLHSTHQLLMTATPIPRTLTLSYYADLSVSIIDELPPGRQPIETVVLPQDRRQQVIARIASATEQGRQVYWVCNLIDDSDHIEATAAQPIFEHLQQALPKLRIELIHGQLPEVEKAETMARFSNHDTDLLVATTVIEVGVDVPAATIMVIENAERMGLAQLHQLRGRVGRGSQQSFCLLLYQSPLSATARRRLQVIRDSHDGFVIAEEDLQLRGPGELLGTRQSGAMGFRVADLLRDHPWLVRLSEFLDEQSRDNVPFAEQIIDELLPRWAISDADLSEA